FPQAILVGDEELAFRYVDGQRIGGVSLQLERMRAGGSRRFHDLHRAIERMVMVAGEFGDDERRLPIADGEVSDLKRFLRQGSPANQQVQRNAGSRDDRTAALARLICSGQS